MVATVSYGNNVHTAPSMLDDIPGPSGWRKFDSSPGVMNLWGQGSGRRYKGIENYFSNL